MKRIPVKELASQIGQTVTAAGFAETIRDQGKIIFLILLDRSGSVQVVISQGTPAFMSARELTLESVVQISGTVKQELQAPGGLEISASELEILSLAEPELPIPVIEKGSMN